MSKSVKTSLRLYFVRLKALISRLRLGFQDIQVLPDINGRPQSEKYSLIYSIQLSALTS